MEDPFESAWLKWAMAVTNAKVLLDNIETFVRLSKPRMHLKLRDYYDARRHCIVLVVDEVTDPFPVLWGVLLGETAHDYRCCLDHVAWALYKRGATPNLPEPRSRNVSFPIHSTREGFNKALDRKLPGVRRGDRAIVRRYQPYLPGESRAHRHVFTVLQEFSNIDKHRAIQSVKPIPHRIDFEDVQLTDCIFRRVGPGGFDGRLEPGAELVRFYVRKTGANPRTVVEPRLSIVPAIHERLTLAEFLERTMTATRLVLSEFADPPASAVALLDVPIPP